MSAHGPKYLRLRELATIALLVHPRIEDAARSIGVSEKTLRNWMARPDFAEEMRALQSRVMEGATGRMTGMVGKALDTLERCLSAKRDADAVRSARAVLEFRARMDSDRLQQRVLELEREVAEMRQSRGVVVNGGLKVTVAPGAMEAYLRDLRKMKKPEPTPLERRLLPDATSEIPKLKPERVIDHDEEES
jgi:hypothetical protein